MYIEFNNENYLQILGSLWENLKQTTSIQYSSVDIIRIGLKFPKIWLTIWPILPKNLSKIWPKSENFGKESDQNIF